MFFSAANPAIESGGMLGESKDRILQQLPELYKPLSILIGRNDVFATILIKMKNSDIHYPIIAKPDIGERGWKVQKITSDVELMAYAENAEFNFLIQEFIDYPIELAILYYRFPDSESGKISSITIKEFLAVIGNGKHSIEELIKENPRAILQLKTLQKEMGNNINSIPGKGKYVELVPIGNHCKGTKFINGNHLIDDALVSTFDEINKTTPGIFFCRYDLKCKSIASLKKGIDIKVMEINGVGAEPAHIYDPNFKLLEAYRVLFSQWNTIYKISRMNREIGFKYMSIKDGWETIRFLRNYKRNAA